MTRFVLLAAVTACWSTPAPSGHAPLSPSSPRFAAPSAIADCRDDRLDVRVHDLTFDKGQRTQGHILEWFVPDHAHKIGNVVILLVPTTDFRENVLMLEARAFDVGRGEFFPPVRFTVAQNPALAPRYTEIASGVVGGAVLIRWSDRTRRTFTKTFSTSTGRWEDSDPQAMIPAPNHMLKDAASPPKPDATTGVTLAVTPENHTATFSRRGTPFGTLTFPSHPGAYIGAFGSTHSGLLWNNESDAEQANLAERDRHQSYLVHLETGAACRVPVPLVFPGTAVFRMKDAIVMLNIHKTAVEQSRCPPGAPCVAPAQPMLERISLAVLRDRG